MILTLNIQNKNQFVKSFGYKGFQNLSRQTTAGSSTIRFLTACGADRSSLLEKLLEKGFDPCSRDDAGTLLIQTIVERLDRDFDSILEDRRYSKDVNTYKPRESIKMIHLLARSGSRWHPDE